MACSTEKMRPIVFKVRYPVHSLKMALTKPVPDRALVLLGFTVLLTTVRPLYAAAEAAQSPEPKAKPVAL